MQDGDFDVEERVLEALLHARTAGELSREMEELGDEMAQALARQRAAESFTTGVLG